MDSPRLKRAQFWAAVAVVSLPAAGTVGAAVWTFWRPPTVLDLALLAIMWVWTSGVGAVAYHRHFAHRSFEACRPLRLVLAAAGAMTFQGPVVYWVAVHRRHHENSDGPGDPHSPRPVGRGAWGRLRGLWHAHVGWLGIHDIPNPVHYAPDLLKDPLVMWANRHYLPLAAAGLLLPAAAGGLIGQTWLGALSGLLWGGMVRLFLCNNLTWAVNSLGHTAGRREFDTADNSRNLTLLAVPTFGESWHNNHHAFPSSACNSRRWWQLDLSYCIIRLLAFCRLAWDVRVVSVPRPDPSQAPAGESPADP